MAGDGCNGSCKVEPNWTCPKQGPCLPTVICCDGIRSAGEVCDDGNTKDGDGCSADCVIQTPATPASPARLAYPLRYAATGASTSSRRTATTATRRVAMVAAPPACLKVAGPVRNQFLRTPTPRCGDFAIRSAGPAVNAASGLTASAANQFLYTMPAQSVSVIVPQQ